MQEGSVYYSRQGALSVVKVELRISGFPKTSLEPLAVLEGSLASVDVKSLMRREKELDLAE
jgi:hypothetical protein